MEIFRKNKYLENNNYYCKNLIEIYPSPRYFRKIRNTYFRKIRNTRIPQKLKLRIVVIQRLVQFY
jgi:hypothetical protein